MLPDVFADADLVRAEFDAALGDRNAARSMVWMDHRSFGARSLLCVADRDGLVDVSGVEDDADDVHRSAAANDDENNADHDGGNLHHLADFERVGGVYFDEQFSGHRAAMVAEQAASGDSGGDSVSEEKEIEKQ